MADYELTEEQIEQVMRITQAHRDLHDELAAAGADQITLVAGMNAALESVIREWQGATAIAGFHRRWADGAEAELEETSVH